MNSTSTLILHTPKLNIKIRLKLNKQQYEHTIDSRISNSHHFMHSKFTEVSVFTILQGCKRSHLLQEGRLLFYSSKHMIVR